MAYSVDTGLLQGYKNPEIDVAKRMSDVLTLADLMDKRKAAAKAQAIQDELTADAKKQFDLRQAAQLTLEGAQTPVLEAPVIPVQSTRDMSQPAIKPRLGFTQFATPEGAAGAPAPAMPTFSNMSNVVEPGVYKEGATEAAPTRFPYGMLQRELERQSDTQPVSETGVMEPASVTPAQPSIKPFQDAPAIRTFQQQLAQEEADKEAKFTRETVRYGMVKEAASDVPTEFEGIFDTADEYDKYLKRSSLSAELGEKYLDAVVERKYKQAQTTKAKAEAAKAKAEAAKETKDKGIKDTILRHDRISNMLKGLYSVDPKTGQPTEPDPSMLQARWPGIVKQARSYGITEDLLPTEYDPIAAQNFMAETAAAKGSIKTDPQFQQEDKLRGEFSLKAKDFATVNMAFRALQDQPMSPAGDLARIYLYMKSLDPTSTVRESEASMVQHAASMGTVVMNLVSQVVSGRRLDETQVKDIIASAKESWNSHQRNYLNQKNYYEKLTERYGLDSENVVGGFEYEAPEPEKPKPTTEEQRYIDWAKANRSDPAAKIILEKWGEQ